MNSGDIYRDAKRRGIYLVLFTDPEGDNCLSIYQISWIKTKKVTSCNLVGTLITVYKHFADFVKYIFTILLQTQHENNFLPTCEHQQTKVRRFLGIFLCDCFIYRSNFAFRKCLETIRHLGYGCKHWIAKDIPSYGSQSKRAKIVIHWFGKY